MIYGKGQGYLRQLSKAKIAIVPPVGPSHKEKKTRKAAEFLFLT